MNADLDHRVSSHPHKERRFPQACDSALLPAEQRTEALAGRLDTSVSASSIHLRESRQWSADHAINYQLVSMCSPRSPGDRRLNASRLARLSHTMDGIWRGRGPEQHLQTSEDALGLADSLTRATRYAAE